MTTAILMTSGDVATGRLLWSLRLDVHTLVGVFRLDSGRSVAVVNQYGNGWEQDPDMTPEHYHPAAFHPVYRDGKLLGFAPDGDDYDISEIVLPPGAEAHAR